MIVKIFPSLLVALTALSFSSGIESSKDQEGFPSGFLDSCPGSTKKAVITKKSLHRLGFIVQGEGPSMTARRVIYNYFQMNLLAKDPDIDFSKKTLVYCGGYLESPNFPMARGITALYKSLGYNTLAIDSHYFVTMVYPVTARLNRAIGKRVAEMLYQLTQLGLDPKKVELIGLSLGGQTMSFIAKNYKEITGRNVSRLTGLDPSGPCYRDLGPEGRLDASDADWVEVIKTNIDGYGMAAPIGHVNFYVNGGEYQPASIEVLPCTMFCSHVRSYFVWASALKNPGKFIAVQCDTVQQARLGECYDKTPIVTNTLGFAVDYNVQGIFYLPTTNKSPYFMEKKALEKEHDFFKIEEARMNAVEVLKV